MYCSSSDGATELCTAVVLSSELSPTLTVCRLKDAGDDVMWGTGEGKEREKR